MKNRAQQPRIDHIDPTNPADESITPLAAGQNRLFLQARQAIGAIAIMITPEFCALMARYNRQMNVRLFDVCEKVSRRCLREGVRFAQLQNQDETMCGLEENSACTADSWHADPPLKHLKQGDEDETRDL